MRQSHQKSRSRGRGRKPQNPLSRNYESNGPDVKIRGNAGHIAEKYSTLARDALSNGDTVMAENYWQHAEHYNRIVAAAQAQRAEEQQANGRGPQPEIEGTPAEVAIDQDGDAQAENSNGSDEQQEASDSRPQKSGRGRRTRKAPIAEASEANGSSEEQAVSDADDGVQVDTAPEPAVIEVISEDASKLPESITGGMGEET